MSVQTILQAHGRDLNNYNYLSLNGTTKVNALHNALSQSETSSVIIAVDNDSAGRVALDPARVVIAIPNATELIPIKRHPQRLTNCFTRSPPS